ncbi:MAG: membrane protein of unknown function [Promethearchaeota archaeon]|nr:MAG: membrane protein of unknown function [Candidatus Lokiarchaeota archaeon]
MDQEEQEIKKTQKPKWWKPFWILTIISYLFPLVITYVFFREIFVRILAYTLIFSPVLGLAYYFRIHPSRNFNKFMYILTGASWFFLAVLFGGAFLIAMFNLPPPTNFIGPQLFLFTFFILPPIIGGIFGFLIGKRRNYRIPYGLKYEETPKKSVE